MATKGTFILADIGGYTTFLTGVGIAHGKEITSHLLNGMIKTNKRRWKVGNVVGDCLFFYEAGHQTPDTIFPHLRAVYERFREAAVDITARSSCPCGACSRTGELSLKFVVHTGEFETQDIGGRKELIGPDVVVAHRLLKNSVPVKEYVIFTGAASLESPVPGLACAIGRDEYDDVGAIEYTFADLNPVRSQFEASRAFYVEEQKARLIVTIVVNAAPQVVWNAMMSMEARRQWEATIVEMEHISGNQGGVGEVHRCLHDDGTKIIHYTLAIDEGGMRRTEKVWITPPLLKETYLTMAAQPLDEGRTRACFFATYEPRWPVVSHIALPVFHWLMKRNVAKDMVSLKEYCERVGAAQSA
jgi:hypothetical protein